MRNIGITATVFGLLGMAGASDTGNGWFTSAALLFGGMCFIAVHLLGRRMDEREDSRIAAQYLVTFYRTDRRDGQMKENERMGAVEK